MRRTSKIIAICVLVVTLTLTIGGLVFAANQNLGNSNTLGSRDNENVMVTLNEAKKAKEQAAKEAVVYKQALKSMQLNYWIAFITVLSLTFLGLFAIILFVQSRKKMATKAATVGGNRQ